METVTYVVIRKKEISNTDNNVNSLNNENDNDDGDNGDNGDNIENNGGRKPIYNKAEILEYIDPDYYNRYIEKTLYEKLYNNAKNKLIYSKTRGTVRCTVCKKDIQISYLNAHNKLKCHIDKENEYKKKCKKFNFSQ